MMEITAAYTGKTQTPVMDDVKIERRANLSYEEFMKEFLFPGKPVIIMDATARWKASQSTPEWFKNRYPDKIVSTDQGKMKMTDFIDAIIGNRPEPGR
jgi:hypothetical protein